jgi:hypothetical protein
MLKLSIAVGLSLGLVASIGCKDKEPRKQAPPVPEQPKAPDRAAAWRDKLPTMTASSKLLLEYASGIVEIAADGTVSATANPAEAAKPVTLDKLAETFGLPPVPPRRDAAFAPAQGSNAGLENPTDVTFAKLGHPSLASGAPVPAKRLTTAFAVAHPADVSGGVVVLADAGAPAAVLVDVLAKVGGFVAVRKDNTLAALPLAVDRSPPAAQKPDQRWVELRLDATSQLERVPSAPIEVASVDKLGAAFAPLSTDAVDVLVGPQTRVTDLVAAIEQLRAAKVEAIGLGRAPAANSDDDKARRVAAPRVIAWDFAIGGEGKVDVAPFRAAFDATLEPMRACFATKKAKPAQSTAQVRFVVAETKKPTKLEVVGIDPALAPCIRNAITAATFPPAMNLPVSARIAFDPAAP